MRKGKTSDNIALFLVVLTITLLLSSLSVTWYHVTAEYPGTVSYRLGIFVGETEWFVFDYSEYPAIENLMGVTAAGISFTVALMLALVVSLLLEKRRTGILLSAAAVVTVGIGQFYFIYQIRDATASLIEGAHAVSYEPGVGWFLALFAFTAQVVVLLLLMPDRQMCLLRR
jgi:hypothetical protein